MISHDDSAVGLPDHCHTDENRSAPIPNTGCRAICTNALRHISGRSVNRLWSRWKNAEPKGYLSVCQAADGLIHLISSRQHYAFNLAWLKTPPPAEQITEAE